MGRFLIQPVYRLDISTSPILINCKIQDTYHIYRAEIIISGACLNLSAYLICGIVYGSLNIGGLLSALDLNYNPGTVIRRTEHIIDGTLAIPVHGVHFLVSKIQIDYPSVRNNLIQELYHHILTGLLSKNQLEHIIVKKVCILKILRHKSKLID